VLLKTVTARPGPAVTRIYTHIIDFKYFISYYHI